MKVARWRLAAGIFVLAGLAGIAAFLAPSYVRNMRLQQFLSEAVRRPEYRDRPPEVLQVVVAAHAGRLGIPIKPGQVQVTTGDGSLRVEVRYVVRVDLPLYTVDLHFRARSGAR